MKGEKGEGEGQTERNPERGRGRARSEVTELEPTEALQGPLRFRFFLKRLLKQNMFKLHALMGLWVEIRASRDLAVMGECGKDQSSLRRGCGWLSRVYGLWVGPARLFA